MLSHAVSARRDVVHAFVGQLTLLKDRKHAKSDCIVALDDILHSLHECLNEMFGIYQITQILHYGSSIYMYCCIHA